MINWKHACNARQKHSFLWEECIGIQRKGTSGYISYEKLNFVYTIKSKALFLLGKSGDSGRVEMGGDHTRDGVGTQ